MCQLQDEYPIENDPLYPHFHTLKHIIGGKVYYWELTLLQLRIWSNYLVCCIYHYSIQIIFNSIFKSSGKDSVTIHQPPHSIHFDPSRCLKANTKDLPVLEPHAEAATTAPRPNTFPPQPPVYPQQPMYPPHYNAPPPWSTTTLDVWPSSHSHFVCPTATVPVPPTSKLPHFSIWTTPRVISHMAPTQRFLHSVTCYSFKPLQLGVPLVEFCTHYKVSKSDEEKLALQAQQ